MAMRTSTFILSLLFAAFAVAAQQCDSGLCCDLKTGLFKVKGDECSKPENECLVAMTACSGFSSQCALTNAPNKTPCATGLCMYGKCVNKAAIPNQARPRARPATPKDKIVHTPTSSAKIDLATKELQLKVTAELEKAKTLLLAVNAENLSKAGSEAIDSAKTAVEKSLELQNTANAEQLALASAKIAAQLQIASASVRKAGFETQDETATELLSNALAQIEKASKNVSEQKKEARANAAGKNRKAEKEKKAAEAAAKVNSLIEEGLPVITKAALTAADKLKALQQEKLTRLVTEKLMEERREKIRIVDAEVERLNKKAKAARLNTLRMFEKEERDDSVANEIKREAREIVASDPEMKMRLFTALTKSLLDSNRERFVARDRKKLPNAEKYAEDFEKEHEVIRRNEEALINSGFFGEKYGRVNITLPEVSTEKPASLMALLLGEYNGLNFVAIALFIVAALLVVIIIFAIVKRVSSGGKGDHKKDDDDDAYENF